MPESLAVISVRRRIQTICFEANLYDLGISNHVPYHEACSKKERVKLNKELIRLGAAPKPLPLQGDKPKPKSKPQQQIEMF